MMISETLFFIVFITVILGMLLTDLLLVGRKTHIVSFREAGLWSAIWISSALLFFLFIWYFGEKIHGIENIEHLETVIQKYAYTVKIDHDNFEYSLEVFRKNMAINYITGYLIEETLSVDNLFVIFMILTAFSVKEESYKPVLFWGIMGAIVLRFLFIFTGAALIQRFEWVLYIFGAYLVYVGIKMFIDRNKKDTIEPKDHFLVAFLSKRVNVTPDYEGNKFFVRRDGKLFITPLLIVVIFIEFSDVIFALDSIPAIFSVTRDPYLVFFSNIFAILGLRSLFFFLIKVIDKFYYLKAGISFLLAFIGVKLLFHNYLEHWGFKSVYSLYVILSILFLSIFLSLLMPKREESR